MGIEALRQQLAEGKLTKEQFAAELKKLLDAGTITQEEHDAAVSADNGAEPLTAEQIQAKIDAAAQSAADKVRTEYATKMKALQDKQDALERAKLTADQQAEFDRKKHEKELGDREALINAREVELHTIDKLTEASLPLSFKVFLVSESKELAEANIAAFSTAWQAEIKAAVEAKFKDNGGAPPGGTGGTPTTKKWSEMNLTERGTMFRDDKEKAIKLAAESGTPIQL